jgi:menaquinone-dependent protoporphyrinogen IX oxidase
MKTVVIYFSYGGATKKLAQKYAEENQADIYEVTFSKKPGIIGAFLSCPAARAQKTAKNIEIFTIDYAKYTDVVIMGPIWAGYPAPPVNNIIQSLPKGLTVRVQAVSAGSGSANKDKVIRLIESRGCNVADYKDIIIGRRG